MCAHKTIKENKYRRKCVTQNAYAGPGPEDDDPPEEDESSNGDRQPGLGTDGPSPPSTSMKEV
jgi:hypothetical protein